MLFHLSSHLPCLEFMRLWLLILISIVVTVIIYFEASDMLSLLGAEGVILDNATDYIKVIALGAIL